MYSCCVFEFFQNNQVHRYVVFSFSAFSVGSTIFFICFSIYVDVIIAPQSSNFLIIFQLLFSIAKISGVLLYNSIAFKFALMPVRYVAHWVQLRLIK